LGVNV
jgi:hypothetical protein